MTALQLGSALLIGLSVAVAVVALVFLAMGYRSPNA